MDNDTLRLVLAAILGPLFWGVVRHLVERYRERHADRIERRRAARRLWLRGAGYRLGRWVRGH